MSFFNNINRFAGDAVGNIGENIGTGYKAADKQFGGILPGGRAADPVSLVKEVAKDALPGHRVHGEKAAGFVANSGKDAAAGRVDLTTSRTQAGKYSGKFREHLVEEGLEQVGKRIAAQIDAQQRAVARVMERQRRRDIAAAQGKIIPFDESDFVNYG